MSEIHVTAYNRQGHGPQLVESCKSVLDPHWGMAVDGATGELLYFLRYFWVNYNDLTTTEPWNHWFLGGNHHQMAELFRLVNYCNFPRYLRDNPLARCLV